MPALLPVERLLLFVVAPAVLGSAVLEALVLSWLRRGRGGYDWAGFGEQMRQISLRFVPTAILSRQVAVIRGRALIINLPGQPKSIAETLQGLPEQSVPGIFAAVPYCIDLIGGPYIECDEAVCKAFRPKSAQRPKP